MITRHLYFIYLNYILQGIYFSEIDGAVDFSNDVVLASLLDNTR